MNTINNVSKGMIIFHSITILIEFTIHIDLFNVKFLLFANDFHKFLFRFSQVLEKLNLYCFALISFLWRAYGAIQTLNRLHKIILDYNYDYFQFMEKD